MEITTLEKMKGEIAHMPSIVYLFLRRILYSSRHKSIQFCILVFYAFK